MHSLLQNHKAILDKLKTEVQREDNKAIFQAHVLDPIIYNQVRRCVCERQQDGALQQEICFLLAIYFFFSD